MATVPYLILTDDNGNAYNFPLSFWITSDPLAVSNAVQKLAYSPGGKDISDFSPKERTLTIEGHIRADTQTLFEAAMRAFSLAVLKGGRLSISNDEVSRDIDVRNPQITSEWEFYPLFKNISVVFSCEFPFWEDTSETSATDTFAGDDSIVVDTTGTDYLISPVITITADQGADIPSVKLRNMDDGGVICLYVDANFVQDDVLEIDCQNGTVKRNGNDAIAFFSGVFLRLQPGSNTIEYEGAACSIAITYKKVYAI